MFDNEGRPPNQSIRGPFECPPWQNSQLRDLWEGTCNLTSHNVTSYSNFRIMNARTFVRQRLIHLSNIAEVLFSFKCDTPVLYETKNGLLDIMIQSWDLENGHQVVHKLARRHFSEKEITAILDTDICQLEVFSH